MRIPHRCQLDLFQNEAAGELQTDWHSESSHPLPACDLGQMSHFPECSSSEPHGAPNIYQKVCQEPLPPALASICIVLG